MLSANLQVVSCGPDKASENRANQKRRLTRLISVAPSMVGEAFGTVSLSTGEPNSTGW